MRKIFISILSILGGLSLIVLWVVGTNGNVRFRPRMLEDWIISALILALFSVPVIYLVKWIKKKIKN